MKTKNTYQPPFAIMPLILRRIAEISEAVGRISAQTDGAPNLRLRRLNRIRTIQGSLVPDKPNSRMQ